MKVRVIASAIRYGSNGFKHKGDIFNLPDTEAKEKIARKLVEAVTEKEDKAATSTKELKEDNLTK